MSSPKVTERKVRVMPKKEYLVLAVVARVDPENVADFLAVLEAMPGAQIVYRRVSASPLFIVGERPDGEERR